MVKSLCLIHFVMPLRHFCLGEFVCSFVWMSVCSGTEVNSNLTCWLERLGHVIETDGWRVCVCVCECGEKERERGELCPLNHYKLQRLSCSLKMDIHPSILWEKRERTTEGRVCVCVCVCHCQEKREKEVHWLFTGGQEKLFSHWNQPLQLKFKGIYWQNMAEM